MKSVLPMLAGLLVITSCAGGDVTDSGGGAGCTPQNLTLGTAVSGKVEAGDCEGPNGSRGDVYLFTVTAQTGVAFSRDGSGGIELYSGTFTSAGPTNARILMDTEGTSSGRAWIPAGSYFVVVTGSGSYSLKSPVANTDGCSYMVAAPGAVITGTIIASDCGAGLATARQDIFDFWLDANQTISVNGSINKQGAILLKTGSASSPDLVSRQLTTGGGSAQFTHRVTSAGWYRVHMIAEVITVGNANYSVTIQ